MRLSVRKILWINLFFIVSIKSYSQTGYIGRKNEIGFDIFSTVYLSNFDFTYKRSFSPHTAFYLNYGFCNTSRDIEDLTSIQLNVHDAGGAGNSLSGSEGDIASGKLFANVRSYGIGLMYNSSAKSMQMPVGYYSGIGFHWSRGSNTDSYTLTAPLPDGYSTSIPYTMHDNSVRLTYGKNTVITSTVTLDVSLGVGFTWGYLKMQEEIKQGITEEMPYLSYPLTIPGFSQKEFVESDQNYSDPLLRYNFYRFYLMPHIRLGYLF